MIDRMALGLLGLMYSGVPIVTPDCVRWTPARFLIAAQPEIGDLHPSFLGHQDVLGLDVAVDQPDLAGRADRLTGLPHDRKRQREVESTLLDDVFLQVRPLDVLHRDEIDLVDATQRVNVDDIRMIELGDRRRFGLQPAEIGRVRRERWSGGLSRRRGD